MKLISIIIPVLDEAEQIEDLLFYLEGFDVELIVVDGGSVDDTVPLARRYDCKLLSTPSGRALQMNMGAEAAGGEVLLFLHADTRLPQNFYSTLTEDFICSGIEWGRFDVNLSGKPVIFRLIEWMMNLRSRWTGISTGDQAIFVRSNTFKAIGGYAEIPLMEDIEICTRLKSRSSPYCAKHRVSTSSRRWENNGIVRTMLLMWRLRLAYYLGVTPEKLVQRYYPDHKVN